MSIYVGAHRAKLCRGDWRPATLYKGGQYIAGAVDSAPVTLPGAIEDTYNDHVMLTALGKGRQGGATGKNLIPYPFAESSKNHNGITFTDNGNGSVTVSGTATSTAYIKLCDIDLGDTSFNDWYGVGTATNGVYAISKYLEYIGSTKRLFITIPKGFTVNETLYPQAEVGTVSTDYEPGMPSPNPEYPQPIVASGGTVTAEGRNLFDIESMPLSSTHVEGEIIVRDANVYDSILYKRYWAPKPAHDYTIFVDIMDEQLPDGLCVYSDERFYFTNSQIMLHKGKNFAHVRTWDDFADVSLGSIWIKSSKINCPEIKFKFAILEGHVENFLYVPYRPPTQITLPTLRAIPDGSGGWVARDSMTPVPHMPGWYDVVRKIRQFELHSTDNIHTWGVSYATEGLTGFYWSYSGFSTPGLTTQCVCSHLPYAVGTWGGGVYGAQANKTDFIMTVRNDMLSDVSSDDAAVASFKSLLDEYDAAGTPFSAWVALNAPTTERVYLGGLKSYPQYTYISADGDYPPDMTATAKFNREEQII